MNDQGWRPLRRPDQFRRRGGAEGFVIKPLDRLSRVHAVSAGSDAALAVTLAGSIFFSISPSESRWRVALYLLVTVAPFAVVTPLIGPAIDRLRGGRRVMILFTAVGRTVLAFLIIQHFDSLLLFPEAFGLLVMQKGYAVAKSAVVPQMARTDDDLVNLNSRLALISTFSGMVGATLSVIASLIAGPAGAASIAMVGFMVMTVLAFKLPPIVVAAGPPEELERAELRDRSVILAASATAMLRGIVGFVTFFLAFEFRGGTDGLDIGAEGAAVGGATATARGVDITGDPSAPVWHFGVVLAGAGIGAVLGAKYAPKLRSRFNEERMLQAVLLATLLSSGFAAFVGGLTGAALLSFTVAISASTGKLAFDALLQRSAPDANYGRIFAKFEARFQIAWVIGAVFPVVIPLNTQIGAAAVAAAGGLALVSYIVGRPLGALVKSGVKSGVRSGRRARNHWSAPEPQPEIVTDELTDDDLRPSQPLPPQGTSTYAAEPTWEAAPVPYVSSVEGVVVDPAAARQPKLPASPDPPDSSSDAEFDEG